MSGFFTHFLEILWSDDVLIFKKTYNSESFKCIVNMGNEAFETENANVAISHLSSKIGNKLYISKGGFAAVF